MGGALPQCTPLQTAWWCPVTDRCDCQAFKDATGLPSGSKGKESACDVGDPGLIPGLGRSPGGGGHGNPLQYSCLKNPHGQRSLVGYSLWCHKESDTIEWLSTELFKRRGNLNSKYKGRNEVKKRFLWTGVLLGGMLTRMWSHVGILWRLGNWKQSQDSGTAVIHVRVNS